MGERTPTRPSQPAATIDTPRKPTATLLTKQESRYPGYWPRCSPFSRSASSPAVPSFTVRRSAVVLLPEPSRPRRAVISFGFRMQITTAGRRARYRTDYESRSMRFVTVGEKHRVRLDSDGSSRPSRSQRRCSSSTDSWRSVSCCSPRESRYPSAVRRATSWPPGTAPTDRPG